MEENQKKQPVDTIPQDDQSIDSAQLEQEQNSLEEEALLEDEHYVETLRVFKSQTLCSTVKDYIISGIAGFILLSDFSLAIAILNAFLLNSGDEDMGVAASYSITFFQISIFALNRGFTISMENYVQQALSRGEFRRINQIFRQTMLLCFLEFLIISVGGSFLLPQTLKFMQINDQSIKKTTLMLSLLMPSMLIRVISEVFKSLFKGLGQYQGLSIGINIAFLIFLAVTYFQMQVLNLGLVGYAISLFTFECISLVVCLYVFFFLKKNKSIRNTQFKISNKLCWLFQEGLKGVIPYLFTWVVNELMIIPISLLHSPSQLTAFAIIFPIPNIVFGIINGFIIVLLNQLNFALGRRQFQVAIKKFWNFSILVFITMLFFSILVYIVVEILAEYQENADVKISIQKASISCGFMTFGIGMRVWMLRVMIAFEKKVSLAFQSLIFDTIARIPLEFALILPLGFDLSGHFYAAFLVQVVLFYQIYQCATSDFREFEGVK